MRFNKIYFSNPAVKEQKAEAERKANLSEAEREEEERRETEWQNSDEAHECVCNGAKVFCPWCSVKIGTLKVTSTLVRLHSQPWATDADNDGKTNFDFAGGLCLHPSVQKPNMPPPPCIQVISLGEWKNIGTMGVDKHKTLLKKSVIRCLVSGDDIKITDSGQEESMANDEKPVSKKCRVEFDVIDKNKIKDGTFGFDSYKRTKPNCEEEDKLQEEYHVFPAMYKEKKKVKDYYVPWVSMRQGTTINLKVKYNIDIEGTSSTEIEFEDNPDFVFRPKTLNTKPTSVEIECTNEITSNKLVKVIADGKVAGGIYFYENKPKVVNVRFVAVGLKDGEARKIRDNYTRTTLENYFRQAFNPAVIDINIENEKADIFDTHFINYCQFIEETDAYSKRIAEGEKADKPQFDFPTNDADYEFFARQVGMCFNENIQGMMRRSKGLRNRFLTYLFLLYNKKILNNTADVNTIYLFLSNISCNHLPDDITKAAPGDGNEGGVYNNGVSLLLKSFTKPDFIAGKDIQITLNNYASLMFLGNPRAKTNPEREIPHEVMHNLGLPHTFFDPEEDPPLKGIIFSQRRTNNYMDYNNTKETTWKYQWDEMRKSKCAR